MVRLPKIQMVGGKAMTTSDVLSIGTPVSLIGIRNGEPRTAIGTVCAEVPLIVEISVSDTDWATKGESLKVLFQNSGNFETVDSNILSVTKFSGKVRIELEHVSWEKSNRRSYERKIAKVLTKCRFVSEDSDGICIREFTVTTNDISLGGAWVQADAEICKGTIFNCELSVGPDSIVKVLGVVAWVDPNGKGFGVEFLNFLGDSYSILQSFISKLAA